MAFRLFLGDQGHAWESRAQSGGNHRIRRFVRFGHRAGITLGAHFEIRPVIDRHDRIARFQGKPPHDRHQHCKIHHDSPWSPTR